MAKIYYDNDADLGYLKGKKIAMIGYGSQGRAHALNLKDSGISVVIGLYLGSKSWKLAEADGFEVLTAEEASKCSDIINIQIPDEKQAELYNKQIKPYLEDGNAIVFSHGFTIHYYQVIPPKNVDVFMVAPKSPGDTLRDMFVEGKGVPGLLAVYQDYTGKGKEIGLAYAKAIGCARAGVIETTFEEETETDLFGEQTVLCGGAVELIKAGFETMVEAGYQPEIAYFECLNEFKLVVDLIYEGGFKHFKQVASDTAEYGGYMVGKRIINNETRKEMKKVLEEIQSGQFAKSWIAENQANRPMLNMFRKKEKELLIEKVGDQLREMMPWLNA